MKKYNISVIKGDGIGPEIVDESIKVLDAVSGACDFTLDYEEYLMEEEAKNQLESANEYQHRHQSYHQHQPHPCAK